MRSTRVVVVVAVAVCLLSCASIGRIVTRSRDVVIRGVVVLPSGAPAAGVVVQGFDHKLGGALIAFSSPVEVIQVSTDESGHFEMRFRSEGHSVQVRLYEKDCNWDSEDTTESRGFEVDRESTRFEVTLVCSPVGVRLGSGPP